MPDFATWNSSRLEFLLQEYRIAAESYRRIHEHTEAVLFERWIKAMEAELQNRDL